MAAILKIQDGRQAENAKELKHYFLTQYIITNYKMYSFANEITQRTGILDPKILTP
jgi:hypothetical protein